jgi:hypothetical protein
MSFILAGFVATPVLLIMWPRYSTCETAKSHLLILVVSWLSLRICSTSFQCRACSALVLLKTKMSSKNTNTNFLRQDAKILFIRA